MLTPAGEVVGRTESDVGLKPGAEHPKGLRCGGYSSWTLCVPRNQAVREWGD